MYTKQIVKIFGKFHPNKNPDHADIVNMIVKKCYRIFWASYY